MGHLLVAQVAWVPANDMRGSALRFEEILVLKKVLFWGRIKWQVKS
jgi:hypothetical protein